MADKLFGALSLCKKAGKLPAGFDAVCEKIAKGEAALVLLAQDVSPGTQKRVRLAAEQGGCPLHTLPQTQNEIAAITRKPVGVLAVTDQDLAGLCISALPDEEEPV